MQPPANDFERTAQGRVEMAIAQDGERQIAENIAAIAALVAERG